VQSPFRRKSADPVDTVAEDAGIDADGSMTTVSGRSRSYTPSKRELGRATPKRKQGGRVVEAPPADRREAAKRMREKRREARAEARAGMIAGKEEYLPPRDKGPERRLVRDIVDARRSLGSYALIVALVVVVFSSAAWPVYVQLGANLFFVTFALGVVVDSYLLTRKLKRILSERFPKAARPPKSHYWYGIMRSLNIRKLRMPPAQVKLGAKV
jgi:hypothetical protein